MGMGTISQAVISSSCAVISDTLDLNLASLVHPRDRPPTGALRAATLQAAGVENVFQWRKRPHGDVDTA